jgi:hypothetical protein
MARSIVLSVGFGGVNFPEDVSRVRELLAAAAARTPSAAALPALAGADDLSESIKAFQRQHMGMRQPTGRIDPDSATLYVLNRVALNEKSVPLQGSLRERIIQAALGEAGKVSDKTAVNGKRHGGQTLKGYFDIAGRNKINWADNTKRKYIGPKPQQTEYKVTNLEGVQKTGMRVPQDGMGLGIQWCGIFATWAWITGGADVFWAFPGPSRSGGGLIPASGNFKAIAPGDMCVLPGAMQHHIIVTSVSADGTSIETIEGNRMWQEIGTDSHAVAKLQTLYSLDAVYNPALKY